MLLLVLLILLLRFNIVFMSFARSISCKLFFIRTVQAVHPDEKLAMCLSSKTMKLILFTVEPMKTCLHGSRSAAGNVHVCTSGARRVLIISWQRCDMQYPNICCCWSSCRRLRMLLLVLLILSLRFNTVFMGFACSISGKLSSSA